MGLSSVKFLFWFLFVSVILWALFLFIARVGAWYLSRKKGISIEFQFGGWRCLKDVALKFRKGAIESISIGEIRLGLLLSFVRIRDPKLQLLLSDLDIVTRPSSKIAKTTQEKRSGKPHNSGKGKLMVLARFISVSVTDLVVKTPRATTEFKELEFDITKDGSSQATSVFRLHLSPITVHVCGPEFSCDQISSIKHESSNYEGDTSFTVLEGSPAIFSCEEFSLSCKLGHDRDDSLVIKNLDISSGEVSVNLNEDLLLKKKSSADRIMGSTVGNVASEKPPKKQMPASIMKYISLFPEKVCFNLPKLDVGFAHRRHDLFVKNNIMGIQLKSSKSQSNDDVGESTRLDVQMEFSEIHLFRESGTSVLEILKVDVISSVYLPILSNTSVRAEIDIKLGGTRCNIMPNRLKPWLQLHSSKKKTMVLQQENSVSEKKTSSKFKFIMWTCTVSAPEMTVVLYSINSLPLYHVCSQSSHMFANNISTLGTSVHMELGELNLQMVDEYQEYSNESLFGVEENLNSLMHIAKVSLDWGKKDMESSEDNSPKCELVLSVDVTNVDINLSFRRLESLISTAMIFQILLKKLSPRRQGTQNRGGFSSKKSGKGTQQLKLNLEQCHLKFSDETSLDNTVIADPKRVNYGSQGGQVVICISADGTPRSANIMSTTSDECKKVKYSLSLDILQCNLCTNKEPKSVQMELQRAKSIYQEYSEERRPGAQVVLFDMQNAKIVRRSGGLKEISVCSYFSATNITVRWEPDLHLSILELLLHLKLLVHNLKSKETENECTVKSSTLSDVGIEKEAAVESGQYDQKHKKLESIIAIDVETMTLSAEAGDGVDAMVQIQSIFSENARIGVLLEGLMLSFNDTRVLKSSRMQISRIPSSNTSSDAKRSPSTMWDLVIQGLDVHICMPFRLQLRAIEDAVEDMLRGLKLITAAKTELIFPIKAGSKPKKSSSEKFGLVKFFFRKITADIEEEPIQGWLDEHFHLLKNEACELAVRLEALEHLISKASECSSSAENDNTCEKRFSYNGIEVDMRDPSAICQLKEEIYKKSFRSYYLACQNLVPAEGSGACRQGFQAGFKPSVARTALLSLSATELDVSLTKIDGGDDGIIEVLRKLDPICGEYKIPFSRMFGRKIVLQTGSLVAHLRNYTFPLFSATSGKCEGCVVLAQQATFFQPQIQQDVFIGKWRKVSMLRSASGTTPPMKTYMELPLSFKKAEVSFGVGYEPVFADLSYAFTVALRRANLSVRSNVSLPQPPKKEKSLPWWDEVRNYIHGHVTIFFAETKWNILATTDPYEKLDKLEVITNRMEIQQSDGRVCLWAKDFRVILNSLGRMVTKDSLKLLPRLPDAFLEVPALSLEVNMDWECDSGNPLNHYLFALPNDGKTREIVFDPFRSTSLSLRFNFLLRPCLPSFERQSPSSTKGHTSVLEEVPYKSENVKIDSTTLNVGAYDMAWLFNFWNMNYLPPHKLRTFSRWARFGVPRIPRSGNLSLDRVMTEFMLRLDSSPTWIKHLPLHDDDPAKGLTFNIAKFKYEMYLSRGKQKFTFECKRDPLDQVYQGLDFHVPKVYLNKEDCTSVAEIFQLTKKSSDSVSMDRVANEKSNYMSNCLEKCHDDGFLLSSDYFTIRKQAPKADPERLLTWQEAGRRKLEMTDVKSEFENGSESDKHIRSDQSDDDDGYNVVIADNCQRVFVYGLKLLWNIENRDAVWSFVGGISKAFEPPKPSRRYALKKLLEKTQVPNGSETTQDDISRPPTSHTDNLPSPQHVETSESVSSPSHLTQLENSSDAVEKNEVIIDSKEEEGTRHFMVNVIEPQFNFHSEDKNGRFLLAAASGRVLARSFHSVLHVGHEIIEQLGSGNINIPECQPEMTWKRMELSMMLEHVQAHVAPTDVDPGAGVQWLPKILRSSPKVKRTGALLERVFMPCDMYFRFTRHKGGTPDLKVKPLKELTFNSHDITATMTSRQFLVMYDVLKNLIYARLPKPRKSSLSYPFEDDEVVEEEADEMVPEGVEEVELARVNLEQKEWELRLLLDDIQKLSVCCDTSADQYPNKEDELWMITDGRSTLVQVLKKELGNVRKCRKEASASLRTALQKAVQLLLMEKEKNKSPSSAMRMSLQINKVAWGMLVDGKPFAEVEINDMIFDFERDFKDVGIARFTTKYFVVRVDLPNVKSDMLLSAWNPPPEWGKKVMLRVDARQGAPKDGSSPLELLEVEIFPLKIYLTEQLYTMMWTYFFPEEEQDSQRRQEVWKVSTTAGTKRVKKGSSIHDGSASSSHPSKDSEVSSKSSASLTPFISRTNQYPLNADSSQAAKLQNIKTNVVSGSAPELRRTSSFDRTWEESVAESVANELVLQVQSSSISSPKCGPLISIEQQDESFKTKSKDSKHTKSVRSSQEEKKVAKSHDEKRPKKMMEFHYIKISQVELLVTYEGSKLPPVTELRLLMDTFHRVDFTGTWKKLFSRVKKHIIWGVLKSVTGMQGKKFKHKAHTQKEQILAAVPDPDINFCDSDGGPAGKFDQHPVAWPKRPGDGAGDGFVTSVKGLFTTQRRKAKAFVLRTMRGEAENEYHGDWSESDVEFSPFARQLTITKAKRLIRRHTKKLRTRGQKDSQHSDSPPSSPTESIPFESDFSEGSSPDQGFSK